MFNVQSSLFIVQCFFLPIPHGKPNAGHDEAGDAQGIANGLRQMERLFGDEEERGADGGHEQCGYERHPIELPFTHQIDGDGPEGEHRQGLVGETEILPDGVETVRITNLPHQHTETAQEHRYADV